MDLDLSIVDAVALVFLVAGALIGGLLWPTRLAVPLVAGGVVVLTVLFGSAAGAVLAGGTGIGAAMTASMWRLGVVMAALYGVALWRGFHHLRRAKATVESGSACETRWCDA
jgi:hypothetical protein